MSEQGSCVYEIEEWKQDYLDTCFLLKKTIWSNDPSYDIKEKILIEKISNTIFSITFHYLTSSKEGIVDLTIDFMNNPRILTFIEYLRWFNHKIIKMVDKWEDLNEWWYYTFDPQAGILVVSSNEK